MTELILRLFVGNYKDTKSASVRSSYGTVAGIVGIITNIIIAAAKLVIGFLAGSIAVIADAVNNFSDAGSSVITLIGFKLSGRPADREHPYGHARYEYVTGLIVSILVTFLGAKFLIDSIEKIISGEKAEFEWAMVIILVLSVLIKLWQCLFYRKLARLISSESLLATSADSRNDCITTTAVLLSAVLGKVFDAALDGWFGAAVAVFILISGVKLVIDTANPLIGQAPDKETIDKLKNKILSYDGIIGIHDMIIHSYGANRIFCSVHAEVPAEGNILDTHDIIDNIEEDVFNEYGVFLVVHMDPVTLGDERINIMKKELTNIVSELPFNCKFHDFRVVFGPTHNNVLFDAVVPCDSKMTEDEIKEFVITRFCEKFPKSVVKMKIDFDYAGMV